jgi:hypothetical protein
VSELRETLSDSLEAAVIKPLPQSDDAVYAQTTDRIVARRAKAVLLLGETDRAGADPDGLFNASQVQQVSRMTHAYLGSDDEELSRMRRFYLKSAMAMCTDYLCVTWPLSGMDNAAQHPGQLVELIRGIFQEITRSIGTMTKQIAKQYNVGSFLYAGGVSSSRFVREHLTRSYDIYFGDPALSSDNAVGIALLGGKQYGLETGHGITANGISFPGGGDGPASL